MREKIYAAATEGMRPACQGSGASRPLFSFLHPLEAGRLLPLTGGTPILRDHASVPLRGGDPMIRKLASGQYRLYSRKLNPKTGKRRNLGTFDSRTAAERHERAVQYFKHHH